MRLPGKCAGAKAPFFKTSVECSAEALLHPKSTFTALRSKRWKQLLDDLELVVGMLLGFHFHHAIATVVIQRAAIASLVLQIKGHAGIDGQGVDVQAHHSVF